MAFDIVELSPAYDTNGMFLAWEYSSVYLDLIMHLSAEISAIAAADCAYDFLCLYALGTDARLVQAEDDKETPVHSEL